MSTPDLEGSRSKKGATVGKIKKKKNPNFLFGSSVSPVTTPSSPPSPYRIKRLRGVAGKHINNYTHTHTYT